MASNPNFNPNCGACGGLNSRGYCSYTACRFPVTKITVITNQQPTTNGDRIRAMSIEELAEFISGKARTFGEEYEGYMSALDWLKEEASDGLLQKL